MALRQYLDGVQCSNCGSEDWDFNPNEPLIQESGVLSVPCGSCSLSANFHYSSSTSVEAKKVTGVEPTPESDGLNEFEVA